ncbi:DNA polymerase I, thermostable [bacterium BMS3Abin01]|nr:DNA polymerase I, thermostable [bacterium BMS3Abin01]
MSQPDLTGALFLIDGNSLAYRAFYALPETIATSDGFPTNALYGFSTMLVKILVDYRPSGVVVAWDAGKRVFRHEQYEEYKAGRKPMPEPLVEQMERFDELVEAFGCQTLKKEGYEADDILATLAREARAQGQKAVIVTADRDALQLVGDGIFVMTNTRGVSEVKVYDSEAVQERYGVPPAKIPDFIGLKGDSSDNIPGVPGIGDKTAAALLADYPTLEELLRHLDDLKGKRRQLLEEFGDQALFSKELATMCDEVPLDIDAGTVRPGTPDRTRLRETMGRYEFHTLAGRLEELGLLEPPEDQGSSLEVKQAKPGELRTAVGNAAEAALAFEVEGDSIRLAVRADEDAILYASLTPAQLEEVFEDAGQRGGHGPCRVLSHDSKSLLRLAPGVPAERGHDTMIAAYLLKPSSRTYRLEQLAPAAGVRVRVAAEPADGAGLATAAAQVQGLARAQADPLENQGLMELFREVEMPLVRVLADMEAAGIRIDLPRLGELSAKVSDQLEQLADEIYSLAGERFNIDSPQQLSVILFDKLKLPPGKKTKTGFSTDAQVLKGLRDKHAVIALVERYRELAKLNNTYIQALPELADPQTWRIHTTFNQTVTATGRLSSSDPNLQNIPIRTPLGEKIRDCFIAAEGHRLVAADYSQVELRILAHLSNEPGLKRAFAAGEDIHRSTAAEVFKVGPEDVTHTQRDRAKAVNFGIIYGISPFGLSEQLDIPQEEAAGYIDTYLSRYQRVAGFRREIIDKATADGFVTTLLGRRRPVPELRSGEDRVRRLGERLAINTVIQGSAADIIKVAMVNVHGQLRRQGLKTNLVLQVHDELVLEAPDSEADSAAELAKRQMAAARELDPPLEVEVGIGHTWLEAK